MQIDKRIENPDKPDVPSAEVEVLQRAIPDEASRRKLSSEPKPPSTFVTAANDGRKLNPPSNPPKPMHTLPEDARSPHRDLPNSSSQAQPIAHLKNSKGESSAPSSSDSEDAGRHEKEKDRRREGGGVPPPPQKGPIHSGGLANAESGTGRPMGKSRL